MKTRTLITIIYGMTVAAIIACLLIEHAACVQIHQENTELFRRLSEATEKLAEKQPQQERAAHFIDQATDGSNAALTASSRPADEEVQRLRDEIDGLLKQHQQAESLREDSRQTQATLRDRKNQDRAARQAASGTVSALQIVKAEYWTDNARMDVTGELQDRIRGDNLKAMANNELKGDPEFGQVKHLTIEYNFNGVTRTNQFQEGDPIILPPPQ